MCNDFWEHKKLACGLPVAVCANKQKRTSLLVGIMWIKTFNAKRTERVGHNERAACWNSTFVSQVWMNCHKTAFTSKTLPPFSNNAEHVSHFRFTGGKKLFDIKTNKYHKVPLHTNSTPWRWIDFFVCFFGTMLTTCTPNLVRLVGLLWQWHIVLPFLEEE